MKYVATLNGKKYEIEIERVEEYKPLDRGVTVNARLPSLQRQQLRLRPPQQQLLLPGPCTSPSPCSGSRSSSGSCISRRTVRRCSHAW